MINIVLGSFFGDCGKGQTVHNLCNKYIGKRESVLVVRFSGGHQGFGSCSPTTNYFSLK